MKPITKFSELIVTLAENTAFVTAIMLLPEKWLKKEWLIIAHVVVLGCKAWYYKDKKVVPVDEKQVPESKKPEDIDIWASPSKTK